MNVVSRYARLVKFSHTLFAMPFALTSYVYALKSTGTPFEWLLLVKILLCMILARNAAMAFNRWADRDIDAKNPRTGGREIPVGKISPGAALIFVIANAVLFIACALWINKLAFYLSPLALFVLLSYSYTKRVTSWSHIVLGLSLAIAPVGAYIAVTGSVTIFPLILAAAVLTWVGGFDILYSMQDVEFDRANSLRSVPARFSLRTAKIISIILHAVTVYALAVMGLLFGLYKLYWTGTAVFTAILIMQHIIATPSRPDRIKTSFGLTNGLASITFASFAIADMLIYI